MNIVHIAPNAPYNEGWGYQENLLTKYQAKLGHRVTLIITNERHENGHIIETDLEDYISKDGFRVIRKKKEKMLPGYLGKIITKMMVYPLLKELKPDFVFYHGLLSMTIFQVTKYKRLENKKMVIVQDNHLDYNIGFNPEQGIKHRFRCSIYRWIYKCNDKYINRVYGVTPCRKTYSEKVFGVPANKTDVLIMGADDEKIDFIHRLDIRFRIRSEYGIQDDDFLIVSGGKIDAKKKIHLLMQACREIQKVKLLVFGNVCDDIAVEIKSICDKSHNIKLIGWIDADKVYEYFFAADLVFFPGQHSVLWEQACASKVPCVFEKWEGMDHVNNGGNSDFVSPIIIEKLKNKIEELKFTDKYYVMKKNAESERTNIYCYSSIAMKSLECLNEQVY